MTRTMEAAGVMAVVVMAALARVAADLQTDAKFLTAHNNARRAVGVPALQWSYGLQKYAEDYVGKYGCAASYPRSPYGMNLYLTNSPVSFTEAMTKWLDEKKFYYSSNSCAFQICGHYTQIVWKTTSQVGCGYYRCGNGGRFVACFYYPAGNIAGKRPY